MLGGGVGWVVSWRAGRREALCMHGSWHVKQTCSIRALMNSGQSMSVMRAAHTTAPSVGCAAGTNDQRGGDGKEGEGGVGPSPWRGDERDVRRRLSVCLSVSHDRWIDRWMGRGAPSPAVPFTSLHVTLGM